jgi:hypothetical protein
MSHQRLACLCIFVQLSHQLLFRLFIFLFHSLFHITVRNGEDHVIDGDDDCINVRIFSSVKPVNKNQTRRPADLSET